MIMLTVDVHDRAAWRRTECTIGGAGEVGGHGRADILVADIP